LRDEEEIADEAQKPLGDAEVLLLRLGQLTGVADAYELEESLRSEGGRATLELKSPKAEAGKWR
jgi:hypothetical protein